MLSTQGSSAQATGSPALYLLKSEPDDFSIDDLATRLEQTEPWDGVRNFQARNIMQGMKLGDQCLFYHSNTKEVCNGPIFLGTRACVAAQGSLEAALSDLPVVLAQAFAGPRAGCVVQPGVVGICEVVKEAYPDETAMDPKSPKFDPRATSDKPRWFMVNVKLVRTSSLQALGAAACKPCTHTPPLYGLPDLRSQVKNGQLQVPNSSRALTRACPAGINALKGSDGRIHQDIATQQELFMDITQHCSG